MLFWSRKARDPVCGMEVEQKKAAATHEYGGKLYYFCTLKCRATFVRKPKRHLKERQVAMGGMSGGCH